MVLSVLSIWSICSYLYCLYYRSQLHYRYYCYYLHYRYHLGYQYYLHARYYLPSRYHWYYRYTRYSSRKAKGDTWGFHKPFPKFKRVPLRILMVCCGFLWFWNGSVADIYKIIRETRRVTDPSGFHLFLLKFKWVRLRSSMHFWSIWLIFTWFNCKYS